MPSKLNAVKTQVSLVCLCSADNKLGDHQCLEEKKCFPDRQSYDMGEYTGVGDTGVESPYL